MDQSVDKNPIPATGIRPSVSPSSTPLPQPPAQIEVDDAQVAACYANFCRIMGTPEELIIDFGLRLAPLGAPTQPVVLERRIVTNMYTAKRLVQVLQMAVQRHETAFGFLETDTQQRATTAARGGGGEAHA